MRSARRRWTPARTPRPAKARWTRSPAIRWRNERGAGTRAGRGFGRDRQLGRHARAGLVASLSPPRPARPADRFLAVAAAVLVVVSAGRGRGARARAEPLAHRSVLYRRVRHAR